METNDSTRTIRKTQGSTGFRISEGPVVHNGKGSDTISDWGDLPRVYGPAILFAIPRDPRTLFAYWSIDWSSIFAEAGPLDQQVYLRVKKADGTDESESVVEIGRAHV